MIETTVGALISIKPILQQLANTEMPARDSFTVLRMLKVIDKEYETIDATQRKIIEAYAKRDENGNYIPDSTTGVLIKEEFSKNFFDEMTSLNNTKIELELKPLPIKLLEDLNFSPNHLLYLENFIEM